MSSNDVRAKATDGRPGSRAHVRPAALLAALLLVVGVLGALAAPAGATVAGWQVSVNDAPQITPGTVDCPSATICYALDETPLTAAPPAAIISKSTDGGSTWHALTVLPVVGQLNGISCPSTTTCYAVGWDASANPVLVQTSDGGSNWATDTLPAGTSPVAISCPTASTCFAPADVNGGAGSGGSETVLHTTDSGATWTSQTVPAAVTGTFKAVACSSASDCAVGVRTSSGAGIMSTTDGGATWGMDVTLSTLASVDSLACAPATTTCFAVGEVSPSYGADVITGDLVSGSWSSQTVPSGVSGFFGISCPSAQVCEAAGLTTGTPGPGGTGGIIGTTDGGTSWNVQTIPGATPGLADVSCATTTACVAVGQDWALPTADGAVLATTDGGGTWVAGTLPGTGGVTTMACPTASTCFALAGDQVMATTDGGTTWSRQSVPMDCTFRPA